MDPEASMTTNSGNESDMNEKFQILKLLLQFLGCYVALFPQLKLSLTPVRNTKPYRIFAAVSKFTWLL